MKRSGTTGSPLVFYQLRGFSLLQSAGGRPAVCDHAAGRWGLEGASLYNAVRLPRWATGVCRNQPWQAVPGQCRGYAHDFRRLCRALKQIWYWNLRIKDEPMLREAALQCAGILRAKCNGKAFFASPTTDRAKAFLKSFDYE